MFPGSTIDTETLDQRHPMKILIVEDNERVRWLIRNILNDFVEEIVEVQDGADALEAYTTHVPDLVLMDIRMPGLDGLRATRQVLAEFPSAKILIVTDYDSEAIRAASINAGATGFLSKQDLSLLEVAIKTLLNSGS